MVFRIFLRGLQHLCATRAGILDFGQELMLEQLLYLYVIWDNIINEDTRPVKRAIEVSHTACKYEFRRNLNI